MPSLIRFAGLCALPCFAAALGTVACSPDKPPEAAGYQQGQVQYGQQSAGQSGQAYAAGGVGGQAPVTPPGYGSRFRPPVAAAGASAGGAPAAPPTAAAGAAARGGSAQVIDPAAAPIVQHWSINLQNVHGRWSEAGGLAPRR